jgi:hypothetical protein
LFERKRKNKKEGGGERRKVFAVSESTSAYSYIKRKWECSRESREKHNKGKTEPPHE